MARNFSDAQKAQIFKNDHFTCRGCGYDNPFGFGLAADHIVPHAKGGKTTLDNAQTLCHSCNGAKGKIVLTETLPVRKPLRIKDKRDWQKAVQANQQVFSTLCKRIRNGETKSKGGKRILKPRI